MLCQFKNTSRFEIPGGTVGWLYPNHPKAEQTLALVEMDGQYPADGYSVNEYCTETLFVIEGQLNLEVDNKKYLLRPNDSFMILPQSKYRSDGKAKLLDIITPSWSKEQNKIISK